MKILILTTNTGSGHNAAAKAIQEEALSRDISCDIVNFMRFVPKYKAKFVVQGHALAYRFVPKTYGVGYRLAEHHQESGHKLYLEYGKYAPALKAFIVEGQYDTVIAVHIFAGLMLTKLRMFDHLPISCYLVITDYTCSPGAADCDLDAWFVPKGLKSDFAAKGIEERRIVESGIPCSRRVYAPVSRESARMQLKFDDEAPLVFICAGTLSPLKIDVLVHRLLHEREDWQLVILCGRQFSALQMMTGLDDSRVHFIEHTDQMFLWMRAADVFITKAGGLTVTEAVSCGAPLILMDAVQGPESYNRNYLSERHAALLADHLEEVVMTANLLVNNPMLTEWMMAYQRKYFSDVSVGLIMDFITGGEKENAADVGF